MHKLLLLLISLFAAGNVRADELSLITAFYTTSAKNTPNR